MFVVVVTEKGGGRQRLELNKETVHIGRVHGNDVVLPRGNVSKNHAVIERRSGGFLLSDLGSTNGTYVNGRRILEPQTVEPNDKIYVGDFILHIEQSAMPSDPALKNDPDTSPMPPLPPVVLEKPEKPLQVGARPSVPSPTIRISEPTEKRIPLPVSLIQKELESEPPTAPSMTVSRPASVPPPPPPPPSLERSVKDGSSNLADALVVQTAKQLNLPDMIHSPLSLDGKTAAAVREFISNTVDKLVEDGRTPAGHLPQHIKGRVFRRAVDLGPVSAWLQDPEVRKIRILSPSAISIFTKGKWKAALEKYPGKDALIAAAFRLAAGRLPILDNNPKIAGFYTEEGYLVHISVAPENPFITVDKASAFESEKMFGEADHHVISESIDAEAKILVVGRLLSARRAVFLHILKMLPYHAFVASVGESVLSNLVAKQSASVDLTPIASRSATEVRTALHHVLSMSPDWLAIAGFTDMHIQDVLTAAASRLSVVAELPLGAAGFLNRELAVALGSSGLSVSPTQAAVFLTESFDTVVVADCVREDTIFVKSVFATAVSERGTWAPKILFSREVTE